VPPASSSGWIEQRHEPDRQAHLDRSRNCDRRLRLPCRLPDVRDDVRHGGFRRAGKFPARSLSDLYGGRNPPAGCRQLGSWTRYPFFSLIALLGSVGVLPMTFIFFKQSMGPIVWQYNDSRVVLSGILFFVLNLAVAGLSWLRWRQLVRLVSLPATPSQG